MRAGYGNQALYTLGKHSTTHLDPLVLVWVKALTPYVQKASGEKSPGYLEGMSIKIGEAKLWDMCCGVCLGSGESEEGPTVTGPAVAACQPQTWWGAGEINASICPGLGRKRTTQPVNPLLAGSAAPAGSWDSRPWPLAPEQPGRSSSLCTFLGFRLPLLAPCLPLLTQPSGAGNV